ncbi:Os01g0561500, partial [Oryza sativa Japonica Group]
HAHSSSSHAASFALLPGRRSPRRRIASSPATPAGLLRDRRRPLQRASTSHRIDHPPSPSSLRRLLASSPSHLATASPPQQPRAPRPASRAALDRRRCDPRRLLAAVAAPRVPRPALPSTADAGAGGHAASTPPRSRFLAAVATTRAALDCRHLRRSPSHASASQGHTLIAARHPADWGPNADPASTPQQSTEGRC